MTYLDVNETINECILRVYKFLDYLNKKYKDTDKNILIVTHMSIVNVILGLQSDNINYGNFNIQTPYPMGLITEIKI